MPQNSQIPQFYMVLLQTKTDINQRELDWEPLMRVSPSLWPYLLWSWASAFATLPYSSDSTELLMWVTYGEHVTSSLGCERVYVLHTQCVFIACRTQRREPRRDTTTTAATAATAATTRAAQVVTRTGTGTGTGNTRIWRLTPWRQVREAVMGYHNKRKQNNVNKLKTIKTTTKIHDTAAPIIFTITVTC